MFLLSVKDIHPGEHAGSKDEAIRKVAASLSQAGNVEEGYLEGMLAREQQTSTYLGNGIAIPHGTTDTRGLVRKTGVQVFQFPQGIAWGEGQTAYIVIGIAASSDEHLGLLRQLTHVLSDDNVAQQLQTASDAQTLCALLTGETQSRGLLFDNSMLSLDVTADDLMVLQALNAGHIKRAQAGDNAFVSHVIANTPLYLGQGVWFSDSNEGNLASAVAISRPATPFESDGNPVALLITVSIIDDLPIAILSRLSERLINHSITELLQADAATLLALLSQDASAEAVLTQEFTIRNEHGLHARPGTMLVNVIKRFSSDITVANLDGTGKAVNGRSLMKVVALGVKKGHRLRFSAQGDDAEQALKSIGEAIASGLGEGTA